ncbi:MAG TPA: GGDEF domain-containing protein [Actinophytocola sp.]|uniref:GGDEF domain-containing protein n=1 Tax=Actinophytocola sp. TaxID=1872138 RepID=UPI002DB6B285|nr:GGDEF domain-containing protein [Actinophytocola sp.]HEU5471449.1 GGDEF domain-containing protein [Actinophytocola sp.]
MNDQGETRQSKRQIAAHPRHWAFWGQRTRLKVYLLITEVIAVGAMIWFGLTTPAPTSDDWFRFTVLAVCATVHIQLSRRQEERRRSTRKPTVHIDLTGIWSFPAVVVLPIHLALLLIVLSRTQRWFVARRPLYRFTFSAASMLLGAMVTYAVLMVFEPHTWTDLDVPGSFTQFGILLIAGVVYFVSQALVIGAGAIALSTTTPTIRTVLGTKEDNELEALTIGLGMMSAILLVNLPAALAVMVLLSVVGNRIAEVRQLQVDVRTDPKTGLLNMRGWHEAAQRALERAGRADAPAAVLMVDLDHFKSINDTWGHPAGDDVLERVAEALRTETRPSDVIGRFGGEEFVLLLPEADSGEAVTAGERIRRRIAELQVSTTDKRGGPVDISERTTSVGIAVYPDHGRALDELVQLADAAVYEAKENGRDQVRVAAR